MKTYKNAIILVAVFAILLGGYFAYGKWGKKDTDTDRDINNNKDQVLLKIDPQQIKSLNIEYRGEKLVFERKDMELSLVSPRDINYDKELIKGLEIMLSGLSYEKIISSESSDLQQYGLQEPQAVVTLNMEDGSSKAISIGDKSPSGNSYYAKVSGDNRIYSLSGYAAEKMLLDKNSVRNRKVFNFGLEKINYLSVYKDGKKALAVRKQDSWNMEEPFEYKADEGKIMTILQSATTLEVKEFLSGDIQNLSEYGLEKPAYTVEIGTEGSGSVKLALGKEKVRGKEIFASVEGSRDILVLDEEGFNFGDKTVKDVMDPFIYIVNIVDVSSIKVEMDGKTSVSEIETDKDNSQESRFIVDGKSVMDMEADNKTGEGLFRVYFQSMIGMTFEDVDIGAKPSGKRELVITYNLKMLPGIVKLEFIQKDADSFYVLRDGKYSNVTVSRKQVERVKETYKELVDFINKQQ